MAQVVLLEACHEANESVCKQADGSLNNSSCAVPRYRFDVVTSDLRGAGTDGALVLELLGQPNSSGQSAARAGPWCLDRPGAFARGQTDTFTVEGTQVQNPAILQVTLQAASQNPEWHCSYVACTVSVVDDDTAGVQRYYFIAER